MTPASSTGGGPKTHRAIDPALSGSAEAWGGGRGRVRLETVPAMAADESGLVHGGFVFSAADHAAMLAVDHPHVVLGGAEVRFLRPCRVGDVLVAEAEAGEVEGKKHPVHVTARLEGQEDPVFEGDFTCFVPDRHVLD